MKELSLYRIRDMAIASGRAVFNVQQLSNLIDKNRAISTVYMSRLVDKGLAKYLIKGRISFVDDDFIIATQLVEPSYISLDSALMLHGIINQVTAKLECVTTNNSKEYPEIGITYHKIPGKLLFGYERESRGSSYTFVATAEKAIVDGIYLGIYDEERAIELSKIQGNNKKGLDFHNIIEQISEFRGKGSIKLKKVITSLEETN